MPAFKVLRSNTLVLDGNKKGRILLEWTPRTKRTVRTCIHYLVLCVRNGYVMYNPHSHTHYPRTIHTVSPRWRQSVRFGLFEEVGLILDQSSRRIGSTSSTRWRERSGVQVVMSDTPDKVLNQPGAGGSFPESTMKGWCWWTEPSPMKIMLRPLEVTAQLGEVRGA
jgi:hypothetical protein